MNKIKQTIREIDDEFDSAFMNNGVNGYLGDEFQDQKFLLIKKYFKQSQKKLFEAIIEEIEDSIR